jgi:predicted amidohydrolase YtcJ
MGTLFEPGAVDQVLSLVPPTDIGTAVEHLRDATSRLAAHGLTWVQDAWIEPADVEPWLAAAAGGALAVDADLALRADPRRWHTQRTEVSQLRDRINAAPGLTCQTLKFFIDGIIENRTAHLLDHYADQCTKGMPLWAPGQLRTAFDHANDLGFDLHLHAIGDGAVRTALDAVEYLREQEPASDCRIALAHAQLIDDADLHRFADLDVTVCFQPLWATEDAVMRELTLPRLGRARELQYRIGSVAATGARISFGSDWPVTPPDVLAGIHTAVTRQDAAGNPPGGWQPQERISVEQALLAATSGVAYQGRSEAHRGHLASGAQADLVWLDTDPRNTSPDRVAEIGIAGTWRRGQRTFPSTHR